MMIPNTPKLIDDLLYDYQRHEILKRIHAPIACMLKGDPDWKRVDDLVVASNNVLSLSKDGEVYVTFHEILPEVTVVWIMDDYSYTDPEDSAGEAILINALDLRLIREGGVDALVQQYLFKSF